jgi:multidrug efflux pump subunit AcrA (membrane-fusion protein)
MPLPSLFRPAAVDFQRNQVRWGDVSSLQPLSVKLTGWFLVCVIIGMIGFLLVAQYARKETAIGYLTPTKGTAKIFVAKAGIIREVHVREGELVSAGRPVLTIETDQIAADGSDVNAALLKTLDEQKRRLGSNIRDEELRSQSERERLSSVCQGLEDEITQLRTQSELQADRLKISENELEAQARAGQNADPQRLQLEIIPADSVLQAELFVPSRAIGFVKPGQSVRILYDAFPYQHFGTYRGEIIDVSQTILTGADAGAPFKLNEPAYRVVAALERPDIDADGKRIALQPDMLLKADIILERRSLMSWLTRPLQSVRM